MKQALTKFLNRQGAKAAKKDCFSKNKKLGVLGALAVDILLYK
jgi:hypothetical protein